MSPSLILEDTSDFQPLVPKAATSAPRTLLVAPPSVSARQDLLERVVEAHDRNATDIQMLDRLAAGFAALPPATYDVILLLLDADGTRNQSHQLLKRDVMEWLVASLKVGGRFRSQDSQFGKTDVSEKTEAVLAGLVDDGGDGMLKPDPGAQAVPLRLGSKRANGVSTASVHASGPLPLNGKRKSIDLTPRPGQPAAGVGFVDFSDDLELITGEDDELIDEDDLLTEADRAAPVNIPPECKPKAGKRRRACKDCTCGLKEKIEAEDAQKRATADASLEKVKLGVNDLAELDFTVQGKVGSCGNCALGDAFRCDGCPYIGLPAFKPGEEVRLLNNDIQL